MRAYKTLLIGGGAMLFAALSCFFFSGPHLAFAELVCSDNCYMTDSTLAEFVQGSFYATGLSNSGDGGVQLLPMGMTAQWLTDTYHLPSVRKELAGVIYRDIIYAIGGLDSSNTARNEIYSAATYITGPIKSPGFVQAATMPSSLYGMAAVISTTSTGGYLYIIGGGPPPFTSTISYRPFDTNGAFSGNWVSKYDALPWKLVYSSAVVRNGNLYVIGGYDGSIDDNNIYRFPLNPDGSLGTRVAEINTLPSPGGRRLLGAVTWTDETGTDYVFLTGGRSDTQALHNVPHATFALNNSVNAFVDDSNDTLLNSLAAHGTVQRNGQLFVTGGQEGSTDTPINKAQTALIDPGGSLHNWGGNAWIGSSSLPRPRRLHASVMNSGGEIYVIGGYGVNDALLDDSSGSDTVYHGPTTGVGSEYAPSGKFTSRTLNLTTPKAVDQIVINATLTNPVTMTAQFRYANTSEELATASWRDLPGLAYGVNLSNTFPVSFTASMVQYRAFLTSTNPYSRTPSLNAFQVRYPAPPVVPDFIISGMSAPLTSTTGVTRTINYYVYDNSSLSSSSRRTNVPVTAKTSTSLKNGRPIPPPPSNLRTSSAKGNAPQADPPPSTYLFFISFYAFGNDLTLHPTSPISLTRAMNCVDMSHEPYGVYAPFIYYCGSNGSSYCGLTKTPSPFQASCYVPANTTNFYAQVDTCDPTSDPVYCNNTYGYWAEVSEANNILGPVPAQGSGSDCFTLGTLVNPTGGGTITVTTPPDCGSAYTSGKTVILLAEPAAGYAFVSWTNCTSAGWKTCTMTMDAPKSVTANFATGSSPNPSFLPFIKRSNQ